MNSWSDADKDLIRDIAKLSAVVELGWKHSARPLIFLACLLWVSFRSQILS